MWGKCLDGNTLRCFYLDIAVDGVVDTFTYVEAVASAGIEAQTPSAKLAHQPCYQHTQRQLMRIGDHTHIWESALSESGKVDPEDLLKIDIQGTTLYIFRDQKLEMSMPAVSLDTRAALVAC